MKSIYIGADHAGFALKERIKKWMKKEKILFQDLGNRKLEPTDDYPDYAAKVAHKVAQRGSKGILVCGSAQGVCIVANKFKGIKAVAPTTLRETKLTREHNDANILCLSGWYCSLPKACKMIELFLSTAFSTEPRHQRRVEKIKRWEQ